MGSALKNNKKLNKNKKNKKIVLSTDSKTQEPKPKNKGGRPSKYRPEFCLRVVELMMVGASKYELCLEFKVNMDTIYEWAKVHDEFTEALKIGTDLSNGWWEREGRLNLKTPEFNAVLWYMNMKNRFGWRDRPDAANDKPIEITLNYKADDIKK